MRRAQRPLDNLIPNSCNHLKVLPWLATRITHPRRIKVLLPRDQIELDLSTSSLVDDIYYPRSGDYFLGSKEYDLILVRLPRPVLRVGYKLPLRQRGGSLFQCVRDTSRGRW